MSTNDGGKSASNDGLDAAACTYPACKCPMDHPGTPGWCAQGLDAPFLFAGPADGAWFVWEQQRANALTADRVAGPFAAREDAEALLGPMLKQLQASNVGIERRR